MHNIRVVVSPPPCHVLDFKEAPRGSDGLFLLSMGYSGGLFCHNFYIEGDVWTGSTIDTQQMQLFPEKRWRTDCVYTQALDPAQRKSVDMGVCVMGLFIPGPQSVH